MKTLVLLCVFTSACLAQSPALSRYEFLWALGHPAAAIRVKQISKRCHPFYAEVHTTQKVDSFSNGGTSDAYRHVFYMAAYAQKINPRKLLKLGKAHEKTNYLQFKRAQKRGGELPDSLSSVMDLQNNELGCTLGRSKKELSLSALSEQTVSFIREGKALILKRNRQGKYVSCEGQIVEVPAPPAWFVEKCLVRSDDTP